MNLNNLGTVMLNKSIFTLSLIFTLGFATYSFGMEENNAQVQEKAATCSICFEELNGQYTIKLPCWEGHELHRECFEQWMKNGFNGRCDICKEKLDEQFIKEEKFKFQITEILRKYDLTTMVKNLMAGNNIAVVFVLEVAVACFNFSKDIDVLRLFRVTLNKFDLSTRDKLIIQGNVKFSFYVIKFLVHMDYVRNAVNGCYRNEFNLAVILPVLWFCVYSHLYLN